MTVHTTLMIGLCLLLINGCTTVKQPAVVSLKSELLIDNYFQGDNNTTLETPKQIFALNNDMLTLVKEKLKPLSKDSDKTRQLIKEIFESKHLGLLYNGNANLIASDTFKSQEANCLSLTIMAFSLAKAAGLHVQFQEVHIPEYWVRSGQYNMLTGHVNLLVNPRSERSKIYLIGNDAIQIDFDPFVAKKHFPSTIVDKNHVIAMFYNNKGAQYIVNKQYDKAYAYLSAAVKQAPDFSSAWGNLALLYRLNHQDQLAETTYRYASELNPSNLTVLTNLSILLEQQGQMDESKKITQYLNNKRKENPFYYAMLADEAMYANHLGLALKYYRKAIKMNASVHEFYAGIAKVYYQMDQKDKARAALEKAIKLNKFKEIDTRYLAKLNYLSKH